MTYVHGSEIVTPDHLNVIIWHRSPWFGSGGVVLHGLFQFCASYANML